MICSFVKRELRFLFRFLLRFVLRSFTRAMGCFLGCLRAEDDDDRLLPTSQQHKSRGLVTSQNPLCLFLSKALKRKEASLRLDRDNLGFGSQIDDRGLKEEVTSLKTSDSSTSDKLKVLPRGKDSESSTFHSCLPHTSFEKLQLEVQSSIPATPIKFCEEWENGKDSSARTPCSSTVGHDTQCDSHCSKDERTKQNIHTVHGTCGNEVEIDAAGKSKSLRFEECEDDLSSRGFKQSPHPTPLKISDEMQTPGTVYPATFKNQPNGHKPRVIINSQILYSDNHLAKSISQCEILEEEEEIVHLDQDSGELSSYKNGLKEVSYENECKVEGSLSVIKEERHSGKETSHDQIPNLCKSPTERPVLGIVAARWNEDEKLQIPSPESWYDNGIPNTTNKYKEDQKVNWHATPFEERLEKALSDKSFISQRNHVCGKPNTFENEDTEIFQLQPSTPPNL